MKKLAGIIGVVLVLFVGGPLWWNLEAPSSDSPRHGRQAPRLHAAAAHDRRRGWGWSVHGRSVALPERVAMPDDDARVGIDLTVRVVWQASPARPRVPDHPARATERATGQRLDRQRGHGAVNAPESRRASGRRAAHRSVCRWRRRFAARPLFPCTLTTEPGASGRTRRRRVRRWHRRRSCGQSVPGADVRLTDVAARRSVRREALTRRARSRCAGCPRTSCCVRAAGTMESAPPNIASLAGAHGSMMLRLGASGDQCRCAFSPAGCSSPTPLCGSLRDGATHRRRA